MSPNEVLIVMVVVYKPLAKPAASNKKLKVSLVLISSREEKISPEAMLKFELYNPSNDTPSKSIYEPKPPVLFNVRASNRDKLEPEVALPKSKVDPINKLLASSGRLLSI